MKYLITGSAGFIGYHLVKKLLKDDKNFIYAIDKKKLNLKHKNLKVMAIKESKTLEAQELNALKELRKNINTLTFQRGQIGLAEDNLELQKITLQEELQKLAQEETKLSTELFEKYGKGNVDLDEGTITPVE